MGVCFSRWVQHSPLSDKRLTKESAASIAGHPLSIPIETPAKGRVGVQQNDSLADGYRGITGGQTRR